MEFNKNLAMKSFEKSLDEREFYTVGYLKSLGIMVFTLLSMIISFGYVGYAYLVYQPPVSYVALNENYQMLEELPLTEMHMENKEVIQWTNDAIKDLMSWSYLSVDTHGIKAQRYFFNKEGVKFMEQFNKLYLQKMIKSSKATVIPEIIDIFDIKKTVTWKGRTAIILEGSLVLKIYGKDGLKAIRYYARIVIGRESFSQKQDGLSIIKIDLDTEKRKKKK